MCGAIGDEKPCSGNESSRNGSSLMKKKTMERMAEPDKCLIVINIPNVVFILLQKGLELTVVFGSFNGLESICDLSVCSRQYNQRFSCLVLL
jgi:hypothetical protein